MKLITRDTDYVVRALSYMAQEKGKIVSVSEMVNELKIPRPFLRKILQALSKKRIVKSYKGQGGGFMLAKNPGRISLVDIMKIFQGPFSLNECTFKKRICPNIALCPLRKQIGSIERSVLSRLEEITVGSLLN